MPTQTHNFNRYAASGHKEFSVDALVSPTAAAAASESFARSNRANEGWARLQERGRIDARRVWRGEASGSRDIFKDKRAPSSTRVRLVVLVDASGSMNASDAHVAGWEQPIARSEAAAIFAATLVRGLSMVPTVRMEVLQHDFGYYDSAGSRQSWRKSRGVAQHTVNLRRAWEPGKPLAAMDEMPLWGPGGGNADGHALLAVMQYLKASLLPGEVPMIIMISDGEPANIGKNPDVDALNREYFGSGLSKAGAALRDAVNMARDAGVHVLSVAIAGGEQGRYYGEENIVHFTGDWTALATELAALAGEMVGTAYQQDRDTARFDY